jgi:hypothetical protein
MNDFSITNKLISADYQKLMLKLLYNYLIIKVISILSILYVLFAATAILTHMDKITNSEYFSYGYIVCALAIWAPLSTYFRAKIGFRSNKRLNEPITTEFSEKGINQRGESFTSNFTWEKLYKVKITNGWLLLYQNRLVANIIKLKSEDESNIVALKEFLKRSNFKVKLKW